MPRERNMSMPILLEDDGMVNLGMEEDDHSIQNQEGEIYMPDSNEERSRLRFKSSV